MNYELMKKYFTVVDDKIEAKPTVILCIFGAILLIIQFAGKTNFVIALLGILLIALGILRIVLKKNRIKKEKAAIPTDQQYDNEINKALENLNERALKKLYVDSEEVQEIEPIGFSGFLYRGVSESKEGLDGKCRTNKYEAVRIFFSSNEVHCYTYTFNTISNECTEETDVYFYKDIVSVATSTDSYTYKNKYTGETKTYNYEIFKLTTAGGTSFSVSMWDNNNAQRSISAMRALLREKKQN